MCSKRTKQFKEKLIENKIKEKGLNRGVKYNDIVEIQVNNSIKAIIDTKKLRINVNELKEYLIDIFTFKKSFKKGDIIRLSNIADCVYDLSFIGAKKNINCNEVAFVIC